jgi:hypothetical protein
MVKAEGKGHEYNHIGSDLRNGVALSGALEQVEGARLLAWVPLFTFPDPSSWSVGDWTCRACRHREDGTGVKRACPRCFALTAANVSFCEECGAHIFRQTVKNYLQLAELAAGLVATVMVVRMLM